jgi:uncharacterized protein with ParB-like and HNH nuclease domain
MKASETKLLALLRKSTQFAIPIYQRTYSWTEKECRQLWEDIIRCGQNDRTPVHFIGSIVYVESGLSQVTNQSPLLVIDGQQRLTTLSLLLAALAEAVGDTEHLDGFHQRKIRNYYLLNPEEAGERKFKLVLSQTDKETLMALISDCPKPTNPSHRVTANYEAFQKWIKSDKIDLKTLCKGLDKLVVVDIALNREQDNPQLIFESMNSTGKELSQADLIRNFILMGLEPTMQTRLYENFWRPMELEFGQEAYGTYFDAFMRHYLTVMTGDLPNVNEVYEAFKIHAHKMRDANASGVSPVELLVRTIRMYASYFCNMAFDKESDKELKRAFRDLRELKVDVAYPFLMKLYHHYATELLSREDFVQAIRWIEAYVFRRVVCRIPTNSMNKTFANFSKALKEDRYLESIAAYFLQLPSYRRFPSDEEFESEIQMRDLYAFRNRSYWLRRFENHERKEMVPVDEYSVEHILPQNENLSAAWRADLGDDWERIQKKWLNTLGNLTLTGYNSEYSDRPFVEKRDMEGGFRHSPLKVNKDLDLVIIWNESAIIKRAEQLAKQAVLVWSSPVLGASVLANYRSITRPVSDYTMDDFEE